MERGWIYTYVKGSNKVISDHHHGAYSWVEYYISRDVNEVMTDDPPFFIRYFFSGKNRYCDHIQIGLK